VLNLKIFHRKDDEIVRTEAIEDCKNCIAQNRHQCSVYMFVVCATPYVNMVTDNNELMLDYDKYKGIKYKISEKEFDTIINRIKLIKRYCEKNKKKTT